MVVLTSEMLNEKIKSGLTASKQLCSDMPLAFEKNDGITKEDVKLWCRAVAKINAALAAQRRQLSYMEQRHAVELALMRDAMRSELIDREGNSARVAEKQRAIVENNFGTSRVELAAFDRATSSALTIQSSLASTFTVSAASGAGPSAISNGS